MTGLLLYGILMLIASKGFTFSVPFHGGRTNTSVVEIDLKLNFVGLLKDVNRHGKVRFFKPNNVAMLSMVNNPQTSDIAQERKESSLEKIKILLGKHSGVPKTLTIDGGVLMEGPESTTRSYNSIFHLPPSFPRNTSPLHSKGYHGKKRTYDMYRSTSGEGIDVHHIKRRMATLGDFEAPSKKSWWHRYGYHQYYPGKRYQRYWKWLRPRKVKDHPFDELASNIIGK